MAAVERGGQRQNRRRGRNNNSNNNNNKSQQAGTSSSSSRKNNAAAKRGGGGRNSKSSSSSNDDASSKSKAAAITPTPLLIPPLSEEAPVWYLLEDDAPFRHATIVTHPPPQQQQQQQQQRANNKDVTNNNNNNLALLVHRYRSMADEIYRKEVENFAKRGQSSSSSSRSSDKNGTSDSNSSSNKDRQWLQSTISKGTLKDRIAAMSVMVSSDPIHKFYVLDGLLQMTGCSSSSISSSSSHTQQQTQQQQQPNSRVAQMAAEALVDLFLHTLVPTHRKLIQLEHRPWYLFEKQQQQQPNSIDSQHNDSSNKDKDNASKKANKATTTQRTLSPRLLLLWRFEELVLNKYNAFLHQYMNATLSSDNKKINNVDPAQKTSTLYLASTLLQAIPTSESVVLQMLVNKLGDPHKKVAATAGHTLRLVLQRHVAMQHVVAREVQQLAHRPHLSDRALYHCIIFLNQLTLSERDTVLPASLVGTYFRLFEVAIQKATTTGSSTTTKPDPAKKKKKPFGGGKKRKSFGKRSSASSTVSADSSSSSSMKSRLLSALLTGVNRAQPFLPDHDQQMEQHVHALYRVVHKAPPAACTQALLLLFHMAVGSKQMQAEQTGTTATDTSDHDGDDVDDEKNDSRRIRRNHKKRLQAEESKTRQDEKQHRGLSDHERSRQDEFYKVLYSRLSANSGLLLLGGGKHLTLFFNLLYKAMKYDDDPNRVLAYGKRLLCTTLHGPSTVLAASIYLLNEIGARHHPVLLTCFYSVLPMEGTSRILILNAREQDPRKAIVTLAQAEATNSRRHNAHSAPPTTVDDGTYDDDQTKKKSRLITAPSWEMALTMNHYHPSVASFAQHMGEIQYSGDPLRDFAVGPFLDKFAYKNPKQIENNKAAAKDDNAQQQQQQQQKVKSIAARRNPATATQQMAAPLNDPSFLKKHDVHVQDEFFHRFFVEQARRDEIKGIVRYKATSTTDTAKKHGNMDDDADDEMAQQRAQEAAEEAALDAAEAVGDVDRGEFNFNENDEDDDDSDNDKEDAFAAYEAQWETDEEEEAFVDHLAQSIIEDDAAGVNALGPGELDDKDPDMDDWGDLNEDDDDDDDGGSDSDDDDDDDDSDGVEELLAAEEAEMDQYGNPQDGVSFDRFFGDDEDELQVFEESESSDESDDDDDDKESQIDDEESDDEDKEEEDSNHKRKKARA
jgi:ribosome biogenesis protein MAK21